MCTVRKEELICKIFHQSLRLFIYSQFVYKRTKEYIIILWFSAIKFNINVMSKRFTDTFQQGEIMCYLLGTSNLERILLKNQHNTIKTKFQ